MIRKSGQCCCDIRSVRFPAPADPPCSGFFIARRSMLRHATGESSDVFLCWPTSSCRVADRRRTSDQKRRITGYVALLGCGRMLKCGQCCLQQVATGISHTVTYRTLGTAV